MLSEFEHAYQKEKDVYRRIFSDDNFNLYVWYSPDRERFLGFQLCYNIGCFRGQKAFTYYEPDQYLHTGVDEDSSYLHSMATPILIPDGNPDIGELIRTFTLASEKLEEDIREYVVEKLKGY
jgi:hypothetical protein